MSAETGRGGGNREAQQNKIENEIAAARAAVGENGEEPSNFDIVCQLAKKRQEEETQRRNGEEKKREELTNLSPDKKRDIVWSWVGNIDDQEEPVKKGKKKNKTR